MIKIKKRIYSDYGSRSWNNNQNKYRRKNSNIKNRFSNLCCAKYDYHFRSMSWGGLRYFSRYSVSNNYKCWTERRQ